MIRIAFAGFRHAHILALYDAEKQSDLVCLQGAFEGTDSAVADCPVTDRLCATVLSLPMHPYLTEEEVKTVTDSLKQALA